MTATAPPPVAVRIRRLAALLAVPTIVVAFGAR